MGEERVCKRKERRRGKMEVKSVVAEESRLQLAEDCLTQSRLSSQVGVVIGKLRSKSERGFVFDLIPTPPNDAGLPTSSSFLPSPSSFNQNQNSKNKNSSKPKQQQQQPPDSSSAPLSIEKDWVAEHACRTMKAVSEAAQNMDNDDSILIHISYSPRRLPICRENKSDIRSVADILNMEFQVMLRFLKVTEGDQCALNGLHKVEFLLPFMQDTDVEACSEKEVVGIHVLSGCVYSFTYINSKEPISQAFADLKGDIVTSLLSRLDIICDEEEADSDSIVESGAELSNELSNQKLAPQLDFQGLRSFHGWRGHIFVTTYIPLKHLEVLKDHCLGLMSMVALVDSSTILEAETEAPTLGIMIKSFWDVAIPFTSESRPSFTGKSILSSNPGFEKKSLADNFNIVAAFLILVVSMFVGLLLFFFRGS